MTSCIRLTLCFRALLISLESDFPVMATITVMYASCVRWQLFLFSIRFSLSKHKCSKEFLVLLSDYLPLLSDTMPGNGRTRLDRKKILTKCLDAAVHTMKKYSVMPLIIETLVHAMLGHYLQQRFKKNEQRGLTKSWYLADDKHQRHICSSMLHTMTYKDLQANTLQTYKAWKLTGWGTAFLPGSDC